MDDNYMALCLVCKGLLSLQNAPALEAARKEARRAATEEMPYSFREKLGKSVEKNLLSKRESPFDSLQAKYGLPMSGYEFRSAKRRYCRTLLRCLLKNPDETI